jgi:hypothetical protein
LVAVARYERLLKVVSSQFLADELMAAYGNSRNRRREVQIIGLQRTRLQWAQTEAMIYCRHLQQISARAKSS